MRSVISPQELGETRSLEYLRLNVRLQRGREKRLIPLFDYMLNTYRHVIEGLVEVTQRLTETNP